MAKQISSIKGKFKIMIAEEKYCIQCGKTHWIDFKCVGIKKYCECENTLQISNPNIVYKCYTCGKPIKSNVRTPLPFPVELVKDKNRESVYDRKIWNVEWWNDPSYWLYKK